MDKETAESIKEAITGLVFKKALEVAGSKVNIGKTSFSLRKDAFGEISTPVGEKNMAFIDGGCAELIKGTSFSVSMIRLFCVVYRGNKRLRSFKK